MARRKLEPLPTDAGTLLSLAVSAYHEALKQFADIQARNYYLGIRDTCLNIIGIPLYQLQDIVRELQEKRVFVDTVYL